jgi:hypothetical protein
MPLLPPTSEVSGKGEWLAGLGPLLDPASPMRRALGMSAQAGARPVLRKIVRLRQRVALT